ncbi:MAG TPA: protelomerase family protein [Nostoc sp.]|uniref:protelomerase family protein n=1 Tax=Nostoc sp. TaxID=1180 RepID=UPI002D57466C|nr:protelomerase family protein [Nostoc sp.]HYX15140.1 protelomerase family protein [Nostoc sp.]
MSKLVQEKVNELFEAAKDLQSLEEIKPYCEQFNEWINQNTNYSVDSLGTVLSRAGFYKKFKSLPLEQGKNAESVPKHDAQGNVTGNQLKHYVVLLCGLNDQEWKQRNETTRVSDRLTNADEGGNKGIEIDPDAYLEVTEKLLASDDPHELAVGLIAATGRRPHEILARGKFTAVDGESYQAMFEGQGKKRGEKPVFRISTLFAASYIIERLAYLRKDANLKELLKEASEEFPRDVAAQNKAIEDKRGNSLRRVVQKYFGGKDSNEPVLNFRYGQDHNDCKALRAACASLVTERDCKGSLGAKMYFAACFLGHITPGDKLSDSDLKHIATTLGYSDYYVTKPVGFPGDLPREKLANVRVKSSDLEVIRYLQGQLEAPNHQSVVSALIESYNKGLDTATLPESAQQELAQSEAQVKQLQETNNQLEAQVKQLQEANNQLEAQVRQLQETNNQLEAANNQLQQEKDAIETSAPQPQTVTLNVTELDYWLEKKVIEMVSKLTIGGAIAPATIATPAKVTPPKEEIDWQAKTDAEVWGSKTPGAAVEKIRRSYLAICLYNDTVATGDGDRLAVTNQALRDLSGCNGLMIRDWIEKHKDEIISHNAKYGMENKKDPSNPASYANKGKDTNKILLLINEEFLSGEGFKAGRN